MGGLESLPNEVNGKVKTFLLQQFANYLNIHLFERKRDFVLHLYLRSIRVTFFVVE